MIHIKNIIRQLKKDWSKPKKGFHNNEETFFDLKCEFSNETEEVSGDFPFNVPTDLKDFWSDTKEASLFIDKEYGQWGLKIFSPQDALIETRKQNEERPSEYESTELIIGEFIGDSDKLLINCSEVNYGKIIVSLPIDLRQNWYVVANSFSDFLSLYAEKDGEKFWESPDWTT